MKINRRLKVDFKPWLCAVFQCCHVAVLQKVIDLCLNMSYNPPLPLPPQMRSRFLINPKRLISISVIPIIYQYISLNIFRCLLLDDKTMYDVKMTKDNIKKYSTRMGFEPTRAEPNGLAVHRLNHSATSSSALLRCKHKVYSYVLPLDSLVRIYLTKFGETHLSYERRFRLNHPP